MIKEYLIANQEHIKLLVSKDVIQKEYLLKIDALFSDEIIEQFNSVIRRKISEDVCKRLACDVESVLIVLEEIDLYQYLKGIEHG